MGLPLAGSYSETLFIETRRECRPYRAICLSSSVKGIDAIAQILVFDENVSAREMEADAMLVLSLWTHAIVSEVFCLHMGAG